MNKSRGGEQGEPLEEEGAGDGWLQFEEHRPREVEIGEVDPVPARHLVVELLEVDAVDALCVLGELLRAHVLVPGACGRRPGRVQVERGTAGVFDTQVDAVDAEIPKRAREGVQVEGESQSLR